MTFITEIYQFLLIFSIIFIIYIITDLIIKMYGRFRLNKETRFVLTRTEKILLWLTLTTIFSYIL
jgi:hypothetical protein